MQTQNEYYTEYIDIDGKQEILKYVQKSGAEGLQKFIIKSKEGQMVHYRYVNDRVFEFYRCCFVPIENQLITKDNFIDNDNFFFEDLINNDEIEKIQETLIHTQ